VGATKRGKGTKRMALADSAGLPPAVHTAAAKPHEVTLVPDTLAQTFTTQSPARLIGDKAYDSDPLDAELAARGVEMIAPHRANRKQAATQEGALAAVSSSVEGRALVCLVAELPHDCSCATNTMPTTSWALCI
jgi:Transposase DDE domain